MSGTGALNSSQPSKLHQILEGCCTPGADGRIDLFERFSQIKKKAEAEWLIDHDKNGYEHSERLEEYLCRLTGQLCQSGKLTPAEVFVLLCAAFMHDVGYLKDGKLNARGHPERSRDYILNDPEKYLLQDFPRFKGNHPRVAEAIGWVAVGHSERSQPLMKIPSDFGDQILSGTPLNLRKLAALLRLADEADDPYIRPKGDSAASIRDKTPLVRIGTETIVWHWEHAGVQEPGEFVAHLKEKTEILVSSIDYLREIGGGNWYLVLHPQVAGTVPFMSEKPVEAFVGRESDLEALHAVIKNRRTGAITGVTGTGGIGKTELARMYAQVYERQYPGGVFWASLKGSNWRVEAQKVFAAIRPGADSALFPDEAKARDEVTKVLDRKGALFIIDNVNEREDIITPECSVLVTTRNKDAFGILPKQAIYPLGGFKPGEGVKFLKVILGEQRVNQDPEGAARAVEILGGMPLAVEIAAKHLSDTPDTTFPDYIGWVQGKVQRLNIEGDPDKDVVASLTLSVEALQREKDGDKLLALFEAGSVCAESGFYSRTLCCAAGFQDMDPMALHQLVGKLRSRSLLEYSEESKRYSMHPLVRQMAEGMLGTDKDREKEYRKNHCTYFLHFAEAQSKNPVGLIQERDGLWYAMVQSIQVGWEDEKLPLFVEHISKSFWYHIKGRKYETALRYLVVSNLINVGNLGRSRELIEILTPLVANQTRLESSSLSGVLNTLGLAYADLGEYRKAVAFYEQALALDRRIGDLRGEGNVLGNMSLAYVNLGEYPKAIDFLQKALKMAREIGAVRGLEAGLGNLGLVHAHLGEYHKALEYYEQALEIARRIGDVRGEANAFGNMGNAHHRLGRYPEAVHHYEKQLEIVRRIGDVKGEGMALGNMGACFDVLGEYRKAIELCEQALVIDRQIGDLQGEEFTLCNMGSAYLRLGENRKAIELCEQALVIGRRIGDVQGEGSSLCNMATAYTNLGEYIRAIKLCEQALVIGRRIGDVQGEGNALGSMGYAYIEMGKYPQAIEIYEQRLEIARRIGDLLGVGNALCNIGVAYKSLGEYRKAFELYEQRLEIARRIGDLLGEGNTLGNMGVAYAELGEYRKAIEFHEQSLEIHRRIGDARGEGNGLGNIGETHAKLGEFRKAIDFYEQQLEIARRIEDIRGEGNALGNMGVAYAMLKEPEKGRECFAASLSLFRRLGLDHMVAHIGQMAEQNGIKLQVGQHQLP